MSFSHPVKDKEKFKEMISNQNVFYTKHFEEDRLPYRKNVTKTLIERHLQNPEDLIDFTYAPDDHNREKYETLFDKSTKYYLKVVLSISEDKLYIVTAHVINKTKREKSKMIG